MNDPLIEIQQLLNNFESELLNIRAIWKQLEIDNPGFGQVSEENWIEKKARCLIHGATKVIECNMLEEWLYFDLPLTATALFSAERYQAEWEEFINEEGVYLDFSAKDLDPVPYKDENLFEYIGRIEKYVLSNGWGDTKKKQRALKSFIFYLRKQKDKEEIAFLEHILPEKMGIKNDVIIRLIKPQSMPISEELTADIIDSIIQEILKRRKDGKHKKAEVLALCWLCLISSRVRLPKTQETIHKLEKKDIFFEENIPYMNVPTFFGPKRVQISKRIASYLLSIADIPSSKPRKTILQFDLHDLRKSLRSIIQKMHLPASVGEITFLTFMHPPYYGEKYYRSKPVKAKRSAP